ncbi:protein disulfide isomerase, putative [Plasmodium relictum]|uniref:Protein disulfide isomerase, putative n=1 Tax=Plasmodium relictum TaxID=85471 RepID=A0A1J1H640_PLARL|nr:protein disulfide isomerase, putative [Plasmodium relictum]CRH00145.1 protein disulfide isomerase, putative [Plasmodium relictum]
MIFKLFIFNFFFGLFFCHTKVKYSYPQHEILKIDSENIQNIFETNDYWLIKFYSPHCVHCKQIWNTIINLKILIQNDKEKKIYFGEVNCDDNLGRTICKKYDVLNIPQLKLFKGNELISTYSNYANNENSIKRWIYYVTTPIFFDIYSEEEFNSYKTEDNIFLICSQILNEDLIRAAKLYYEENYFINIKNHEICEKLNIKSNQLYVKGLYKHSTYNLDQVDFKSLKSFINKNRFPLVNKIDHHNFFNLRSSGNNLILLLLDLKKSHNVFISVFTKYAEKYKSFNDLIFGFIDGNYYKENLELYGIDSRNYPQIIVFSKNPREYYFEDDFDLDHVDKIIDNILNNKINSKVEEFTKTKILLSRFKKHMNHILEKAFRTDYISFFGFLCSVILIIFTAILVIHTIYKFINKSGPYSKEKSK